MTNDIPKLRELLAKATPGVWIDDPECAPLRVFSNYIPPGKTAGIAPVICETLPFFAEPAQGQANAALIAAMQAALPDLLDEIEALLNKVEVIQRRTTRHSLAKDLGSAVDGDAAIMARITAERDAALGEIEALRKQSAEPARKVTDEIVEEMAKLFHEANNYRGSWDGPDCPFKNSIRVGMRAALKAAGIEVTNE